MKLLTKKEVSLYYKILNEKAVPWDESIVGNISKGLMNGLSFITGKIDNKIKSQRIQSLLLQWGAEYIAAIDKVYREKIENVDSVDEDDGEDNKENKDDVIEVGKRVVSDANKVLDDIKNNTDDTDTDDNYTTLSVLVSNLNTNYKIYDKYVFAQIEELKDVVLKGKSTNESVRIYEALDKKTQEEIRNKLASIFTGTFSVFKSTNILLSTIIRYTDKTSDTIKQIKDNLIEFSDDIKSKYDDFVSKYVNGYEQYLEKWENGDFDELEDDVLSYGETLEKTVQLIYNIKDDKLIDLLKDLDLEDGGVDEDATTENTGKIENIEIDTNSDKPNFTDMIKNIEVLVNYLVSWKKDIDRIKKTSPSNKKLKELSTLYNSNTEKYLTDNFIDQLEKLSIYDELKELVKTVIEQRIGRIIVVDFEKYEELIELTETLDAAINEFNNIINLLKDPSKLTRNEDNLDTEPTGVSQESINIQLKSVKKLGEILTKCIDMLKNGKEKGGDVMLVLKYKHDQKFNEILSDINRNIIDTTTLNKLNDESDEIFDKKSKEDPKPYIDKYNEMLDEIKRILDESKTESLLRNIFLSYINSSIINEGITDWIKNMGSNNKREISKNIDNLYDMNRIEKLKQIKDIQTLVESKLNIPRLESIKYEANTIIEDLDIKNNNKNIDNKDKKVVNELKREWERGILELSDKFQDVIDTPKIFKQVKGTVDDTVKKTIKKQNDQFDELEQMGYESTQPNNSKWSANKLYSIKSTISMDRKNKTEYNLFVSPIDDSEYKYNGLYIFKLYGAYKYDKKSDKILLIQALSNSTQQSSMVKEFGNPEKPLYLAYTSTQYPQTNVGLIFNNKGQLMSGNNELNFNNIKFTGEKIKEKIQSNANSEFVFTSNIIQRFVCKQDFIYDNKYPKINQNVINKVDSTAIKNIKNTIDKITK